MSCQVKQQDQHISHYLRQLKCNFVAAFELNIREFLRRRAEQKERGAIRQELADKEFRLEYRAFCKAIRIYRGQKLQPQCQIIINNNLSHGPYSYLLFTATLPRPRPSSIYYRVFRQLAWAQTQKMARGKHV